MAAPSRPVYAGVELGRERLFLKPMSAEMPDLQFQSTAELLRRYRRAAGLTQEELAERAAVSARSVSDIERGISLTPHRSTLDGLADALDLTPKERHFLQASVRAVRGPDDGGLGRPEEPNRPNDRYKYRLVHVIRWVIHHLSYVVARVQHSPPPLRFALSLAVIGLSAGVAFRVMKGSNAPQPISAAQTFVPWHVTRQTGVTTGFTTGLAIDGSGNVYASTFAATARASGVWKLAPSGQVLDHWGRYGRSTIYANDLDVDQHGNIFVVDASHSNVLKIAVSGEIAGAWGSPGSTPGKFVQPDALAVDRQGHVFVGDATGRIQIFSEAGKLLAVWPNCGVHRQGYCHPNDMATDAQGNLYVTDLATASVWKISPTGNSVADWGTPGSDPTQFYNPGEIAFGRRGNIFVADPGNGRIHQFSPTGKPTVWWGSTPGVLSCPSALTIDRQSNVFVGTCGRVVKYSVGGVLFADWRVFEAVPVSFESPSALAVDPQGRVFVASSDGTMALNRISSSGRLVTSWATSVLGPGEAHALTGAATDSSGNMYVVDAVASRVLKVSPSGKVVGIFGREGSGPGQLESPSAVAVDRTGKVYVSDTGNRRVVTFSSSGLSLGAWNTASNGTALFLQPQGIAVDPHGDVYVADEVKHAVDKLSSTGALITRWGGTDSTLLSLPVGIAVDHRGLVYVTDVGDSQVKALSPTGRIVAEWGKRGSRPGDFNQPTALALDQVGTVYVADTGNNRIQILTSR